MHLNKADYDIIPSQIVKVPTKDEETHTRATLNLSRGSSPKNLPLLVADL